MPAHDSPSVTARRQKWRFEKSFARGQVPASVCIASNQMLLNFGHTRSLGGSSHEMRGSLAKAVGKIHRNALADLICPCVGPAPSTLLVSTVVRAMGHYVNHSVRGFRPPARWRIASARFDLPRLRMRCIIRPRVVVPAIPSAPVAAHSIASMLYEVSRPSGTFLIPDCTPAEHPNSRRNTRSAGCIASGPY